MAQSAGRGDSMSFPVTAIQTLAAFAIFAAGYLVLLVAAIFVLVLASCIYRGGRLMNAYTVRTANRDRDWSLENDGLHQGVRVQR